MDDDGPGLACGDQATWEQAVLAAGDQGVVVVDDTGILHANAAAHRLFGFALDGVVGQVVGTNLSPVVDEHGRALGPDENVVLEVLRTRRPALSDVVLPGIPGPEAAERARQLVPGLRVVFMSGYTAGLPGDHQVVGDLLAKPFTAATLLESVARALATPSAP